MKSITKKHSELINDARIGQILNNDMNHVRSMLKTYCLMRGFTGELLNASNKCYIFTDIALRDYICGTLNESKVLPKKYAVEFLSQL
jgi:hypothetical protein